MTGHKNTLKRDEFTEEEYQEFEMKLFSSLATVSELERICMTLAHLPTKHAQDLLKRFKESDRAHEVKWLDMALEEGEFHYLSPGNEQEERDYLALKVMQEIEDEILELQIKCDEFKLDLDKMEIKQEAVRELIKKGELDADEELGFHDVNVWIQSNIDELHQQIMVKEKTFNQVKESIKTERYKDVDPQVMRDIHFS
ncbi:MAG: hypothetical protein JSV88_16430 [Candidatus Aminicenantes bacterium]|nr:MAG: hypothetical protein JSV88_16430 [Candidatus Aminicenantes bacterium]